ncbi:MAG: hypothetical protein P1U68_00470 [Verrucomicrobiales bacterium]|nr:hypothetical protein [Verrucomicrobiales bacterium]
MEPKERVRIYRDEIPMGRKVLFDMEHLRTWAGNDEAQNPELRIDDAEFHRPPVGSWVVFYGKLLDFPSPTTKFPRVERSHYRRTERAASSDARVLSRALGMKVAVCKVLDRIDWH